MRRSKVEVYLHIVWATWRRQPYISPEIERAVYRCIEKEIKRLQATVLALGGIENHVHLLVRIPATLPISRLANQIKGVSSRLVKDQFSEMAHFRWQENYAVFSVGRTQVAIVQAYVLNQKQHHAENTLHATWEETDEESLKPGLEEAGP